MMPAAKRTQPKTAAIDVTAENAKAADEQAESPRIEPGVFNTDELRTKRALAEQAGDTAAVAHIDALIREDEAAARMNT